MVNARQGAHFLAEFLGQALLGLAGLGIGSRHRLLVDAVVRVARLPQRMVLKAFEQDDHALEAVAAMAVAGVGQEADHRPVDLALG
jgi:hypothetical protein